MSWVTDLLLPLKVKMSAAKRSIKCIPIYLTMSVLPVVQEAWKSGQHSSCCWQLKSQVHRWPLVKLSPQRPAQLPEERRHIQHVHTFSDPFIFYSYDTVNVIYGVIILLQVDYKTTQVIMTTIFNIIGCHRSITRHVVIFDILYLHYYESNLDWYYKRNTWQHIMGKLLDIREYQSNISRQFKP